MKLIVFGATGMVGAGTLREALADSTVESVLVIGRRSCGVAHPKLREHLMDDLFDVTAAEPLLTGWDAALWCVGVSSVGMSERDYTRVTHILTMRWAETLARLNPGMSFCYCSAMGADGRSMWALVRRRFEKALEAVPFRHVGCVRPGFIRPGPGIRSQVRLYQALLSLSRPLIPLIVALLPGLATTSERLGRAMLRVVQGKSDRYLLESRDINRLGA